MQNRTMFHLGSTLRVLIQTSSSYMLHLYISSLRVIFKSYTPSFFKVLCEPSRKAFSKIFLSQMTNLLRSTNVKAEKSIVFKFEALN